MILKGTCGLTNTTYGNYINFLPNNSYIGKEFEFSYCTKTNIYTFSFYGKDVLYLEKYELQNIVYIMDINNKKIMQLL